MNCLICKERYNKMPSFFNNNNENNVDDDIYNYNNDIYNNIHNDIYNYYYYISLKMTFLEPGYYS